MPAWVWITAAAAAVFVLLALWGRGWWYSWRHAAHVLQVTETEIMELCVYCGKPALGYARNWNGERLCHHEDRDCYQQVTVYGSMSLDDERALYWPAPTRWEMAREDGRGWLEQTAAALSPEALDSDVQPDPYLDAIMAGYESEFDLEDSGPGVLSSLPPGPDSERLCGPGQPHEKPAGTESAGPGLTRLADTADVLDAHLLAEVTAELRAQDDDTAMYLSRLRSECARYRLDVAAALA